MKNILISKRAMDRFINPKNLGPVQDANGYARITGPCGDTVEIWLRIEEGRIKEAGFNTDGCGPSRACGSMATELLVGRPLQVAFEMEQEDILEDLEPFPDDYRHCALLAANTVKAAAQDYENNKPGAEKTPTSSQKETERMRIAVPVANGKLALHFGHCEAFVLVDADPETKQITGTTSLTAPPHQPGLLPPWLAEQGANVIIAGGMGSRAQALFTQQQIQVVVGAPPDTPENLVTAYLNNTLQAGQNLCDH